MIRPNTVEAAVAAHEAGAVYAGGMTIHMLDRAADRVQPTLIDLSRLPELSRIQRSPAGVSIGAMTTLETMRCDPLLNQHFPAIVRLLASVGSLALRHQATLGGNVAWGHGDLIVPLLALGAGIVTPDGQFPIGEQHDGALILSVELPLSDNYLVAEKVGFRAAFSPTLVTVAACFSDVRTRLAAGGGPTRPTRLLRAEALLKHSGRAPARIERADWAQAVRNDAVWGSDALADGRHRADVAARVLFDMAAAGGTGHG